jgi:hypothetical protein
LHLLPNVLFIDDAIPVVHGIGLVADNLLCRLAGDPARSMLRATVRLESWKRRCGCPAFLRALRQAV